MQKYELKRHRTVHENIKYTCPYCEKVVKRKPSMLKHLRLQHKDKEYIWSDNDFIAQLKYFTKSSSNGFAQSESSNTNESSTDERNNGTQKKLTSSVIGSIDHGEFKFNLLHKYAQFVTMKKNIQMNVTRAAQPFALRKKSFTLCSLDGNVVQKSRATKHQSKTTTNYSIQ